MRNTGKVREKSGNSLRRKKWEPCFYDGECFVKFVGIGLIGLSGLQWEGNFCTFSVHPQGVGTINW